MLEIAKGWSQTPKCPTPKLQFTHDLRVAGRGDFKEQRKRRIISLLAAAVVGRWGSQHGGDGKRQRGVAKGRNDPEEDAGLWCMGA